LTSALSSLPAFSATLKPDWIDYNGHLRDAYYGLILSHAIDDVMDHLGLDAQYRARTHCTLYTLEMHIHYLHEVKESDALQVHTSILDADRKRIHAGCRFSCARLSEPVATGDVMLLHVHQGEKPASAPFAPDVEQKLQALQLPPDLAAAWGPRSRAIEILRRAPK
jgi:acyl-CoA thioester hydrolase